MQSNIMLFRAETDDFILDHQIKSCYDPDAYTMHAHKLPELIYVKKISGSHIIEDKEYKLSSEDLILIPPGAYHRLLLEKNSEYERYNLIFEPKILGRFNTDKIYNSITVVNCSLHSVIADIFNKTDYYYQSLSSNNFEDIIKLLIKEIFFNFEIYSESDYIKPERLNPILSAATDYINKNLFQINDISEISEHLFISESYLYKIFHEYLKISPKQYIISKKMHIAKREIASGAKPVEVAHKMKFNDYSTFFRAYRNFFGHTPAQNRKKEYLY